MIPGFIRENTGGYTYKVNGNPKDGELTTYQVYPRSILMNLKLLFRRTHKLNEVLYEFNEGNSRISYTRVSTYKMYKGTRMFLSSYISCYIHVKFEEDDDGGAVENNSD